MKISAKKQIKMTLILSESELSMLKLIFGHQASVPYDIIYERDHKNAEKLSKFMNNFLVKMDSATISSG